MKDKVCKYIRSDYELFVKCSLEDHTATKFHPNEFERVQTITNKAVLQQRANAYLLLKCEAGHWVDHKKSGAPVLMKNGTAEKFSVSFSHKETAVAAAISKTENKSIGVDLELLNTGKDFGFLKDKVISSEEQFFLDRISISYSLSEKDTPLFFWVLKEAAFKAQSGQFEVSDFRVKLKENEIILSCIYSKNIFASEVFVIEDHIVAVVTTEERR